MITQEELKEFSKKEIKLKMLKDELEKMGEALEVRVKANEKLEEGDYKAYMKDTSRKSVAWKEICEEQLGKKFIEKTLEGAEVKSSEKLEVIKIKVDKKLLAELDKEDVRNGR